MERLTFRQRLRWFADYYLFKVILITAGAVLAFILLKLAMFPGSTPEAEILVISKVRGDYSQAEDRLSENWDIRDRTMRFISNIWMRTQHFPMQSWA